MGIGWTELLLILLILLLVFGANRLPQLGEGLGKAIRGLKRGLSSDDDIDVTPKDKQVGDTSSAKPLDQAKVTDAEIVEKKR